MALKKSESQRGEHYHHIIGHRANSITYQTLHNELSQIENQLFPSASWYPCHCKLTITQLYCVKFIISGLSHMCVGDMLAPGMSLTKHVSAPSVPSFPITDWILSQFSGFIITQLISKYSLLEIVVAIFLGNIMSWPCFLYMRLIQKWNLHNKHVKYVKHVSRRFTDSILHFIFKNVYWPWTPNGKLRYLPVVSALLSHNAVQSTSCGPAPGKPWLCRSL